MGGDSYEVEVDDGAGTTHHEVTAAPSDVIPLSGGGDVERLIEASFEFLLEREPKESILARFDLTVIGRYFPEYTDEIRRRLE